MMDRTMQKELKLKIHNGLLLYQTRLIAKPPVHHPYFFDCEAAFLYVWLYAKDADSALQSAHDCAAAMGWEEIQQAQSGPSQSLELLQDSSHNRFVHEQLLSVGVAYFVIAIETGGSLEA